MWCIRKGFVALSFAYYHRPHIPVYQFLLAVLPTDMIPLNVTPIHIMRLLGRGLQLLPLLSMNSDIRH